MHRSFTQIYPLDLGAGLQHFPIPVKTVTSACKLGCRNSRIDNSYRRSRSGYITKAVQEQALDGSHEREDSTDRGDSMPTAIHSPLKPSQDCKTLEEYRECMLSTQESLNQLIEEFGSQMASGLQEDGNLLMIPTLVDVIPDGREAGELYGVEFGGSKLRLVYTRLPKEQHAVDTVQISETTIPDEKKHCSADDLFSYIAQNAISFALSNGRDLRKIGEITVGFCFSFPVSHISIKSGKIIKWTKGFENEGAVGSDPVKLLTSAFQREGVKASIQALVNDTVGVLCATRYTSGPAANIAVVMGTGTNACYVEQMRNISKFKPKYFARTPEMVVNIEWPGFHSESMPILEEDRQLDEESHKPGDQRFEKLTSGLYLGDIARRIIHRLAIREGWFGGKCDQLGDPSRFSTVELSMLSQDDSDSLGVVAHVLAEVLECTPEDIDFDVREKAKEVCYLVTRRSAQLIAASIVGILVHIGKSQKGSESEPEPENIIAVDGGIFTEYHLYKSLLQTAVAQIAGQAFADNFQLKMTEGGASFGAATLAAAGARYENVMGRGAPRTPERKFPPRGQSQMNLAAMQ